MLSEKVTALFTLLQCSNTDIAKYAGCSSANISRLKTGYRTPKPGSPTLRLLADGVYGYADYENMLTEVAGLCGSPDTTRENLIPSLIAWLYGTDVISLPARPAAPKSKRLHTLRRQNFGIRLDQSMTLLDISNKKLATILAVDDSLVSRYRSGIYSPHGNEQLSEKLSDIIFTLAQETGRTAELASLCGTDAEHLNADTVAAWLFDLSLPEDSTAFAQKFLQSLNEFTPKEDLPFTVQKNIPRKQPADCYYGTDGLRDAVIRFLSDAAAKGGELLLYSDEPMDWMTGDPAFFTLWASLMMQCVNSGVKIKIIHNVDRKGTEMINAIRGWFPLYVSGMIEPFVFQKERNTRFYHTAFLHSGTACIHGFTPADGNSSRWYDYVTDAKRLSLIEDGYRATFSAASPFLKVFKLKTGDDYRRYCADMSGTSDYLLTGFPAFTMPEKLLKRILTRAGIEESDRRSLLTFYRRLRKRFLEHLREDAVRMILCVPGESPAQAPKVSFGYDLSDLSLLYAPDEYAEHIAAIKDLIKNEKNFHLTLLPDAPFRDIQIITAENAVSILRRKEPHTAFVFSNADLTESVKEYLTTLHKNHAADRHSTLTALDSLQKTYTQQSPD